MVAFSNNALDSIINEANNKYILGHKMEALEQYKLYEDLLTDHFYKNYDQEVQSIYQTYEIDEKELENTKSENQLIIFLLLSTVIFLIICLYIYKVLRKKYKELVEARKELYSAKQLAEYSIKNKSLMISNMSHEIRTPLNALTGFSEILTLEDIDEYYKSQCLDIIKLNSELLTKLINDVINVRGTEINELEFTISECDIISLCQKVVKIMNKIKDCDAEIIFTTDIESLTIYTDIERIQQIIINLMNNAIKFCKNGTITLSVNKTNDNIVTFSVSDTGCGIPSQLQNKIFERFEKLNENISGTGLGLSICKLIIERLNGKIYLDTTYKNGAKFVFNHPVKIN